MTTEQNRATALKLVATLGAGAPDMSLVTDDAVWWAPGRGEFDNETFAKMASGFASMFKNPSQIAVHGVTAEDNRVAIEAQGHAELTNGKVYRNTYHYLFVFQDGKICQGKLYNDTQHAKEIAG